MIPKDRMKMVFVTYSIEQSLLDIGGEKLKSKVEEFLKKRYDSGFSDCYSHPDYLHDALFDLYGRSAKDIVRSIREKLEDFDYQKPIARFIKEI